MLFTGRYDHTIDERNRLSIPSQIRVSLDPRRDGERFYVVPGLRPRTLSLFPEKYFERLAKRLETEQFDDDLLTFEQIFYAMATRLDMDRHGRVLIPEPILKFAGIGREVALIGARDRLDIWNRKEYDEFLAQEWPRYDEIQRKARLAMRRPARSERPDRPPHENRRPREEDRHER